MGLRRMGDDRTALGREEQTWAPMTPALARMLGLEQMARTYRRHGVRRRMSRLVTAMVRLFGAG